MEDEQIKEYITALLQPTLQSLNAAVQSLNAVEQRLQSGLDARLQVVDQLLLERHALQVNAMAVNDARFAALIAYVTGQDVGAALEASRDGFKSKHPALFDAALWRVEPDWLIALQRR